MLSHHPDRALTALVVNITCIASACAEPGRTMSPLDAPFG